MISPPPLPTLTTITDDQLSKIDNISQVDLHAGTLTEENVKKLLETFITARKIFEEQSKKYEETTTKLNEELKQATDIKNKIEEMYKQTVFPSRRKTFSDGELNSFKGLTLYESDKATLTGREEQINTQLLASANLYDFVKKIKEIVGTSTDKKPIDENTVKQLIKIKIPYGVHNGLYKFKNPLVSLSGKNIEKTILDELCTFLKEVNNWLDEKYTKPDAKFKTLEYFQKTSPHDFLFGLTPMSDIIGGGKSFNSSMFMNDLPSVNPNYVYEDIRFGIQKGGSSNILYEFNKMENEIKGRLDSAVNSNKIAPETKTGTIEKMIKVKGELQDVIGMNKGISMIIDSGLSGIKQDEFENLSRAVYEKTRRLRRHMNDIYQIGYLLKHL